MTFYQEQSICAELGRCAYALAAELYGGARMAEGCPHWKDCFKNREVPDMDEEEAEVRRRGEWIDDPGEQDFDDDDDGWRE